MVRVHEDPGRRTHARERRVLVDRLWPRGTKKEAIDYDEWAKDVAPSTELRRWYGHDPERFAEFSRRYRKELQDPTARQAVKRLRDAAAKQRLVLLTATRDVDHSGATVLSDVIKKSRA